MKQRLNCGVEFQKRMLKTCWLTTIMVVRICSSSMGRLRQGHLKFEISRDIHVQQVPDQQESCNRMLISTHKMNKTTTKKRPLIQQGRNFLFVGDALAFIFLLYNLYVVAGAPAARTDHERT